MSGKVVGCPIKNVLPDNAEVPGHGGNLTANTRCINHCPAPPLLPGTAANKHADVLATRHPTNKLAARATSLVDGAVELAQPLGQPAYAGRRAQGAYGLEKQ
jgi:hypothetical protein